MAVTSANTRDLQAFVGGSERRIGRLSTTLNAVVNKANVVMPACSGSQYPSTPSLAAVNGLLTSWYENQEFVRVVHDDLVEADQYDADGNATISDAVIDASLEDAGMGDAPDLVEVAAIELYGQPPYSGFVDDPICLANGNFLLREGDLGVLGSASALSVTRAYNSRDPHVGAFGRGWTSLVDVALVVDGRRASFRGPDGSGSAFAQDDDGSWVGGRRRRQTLEEADGGWTLTEGHDRTWTFDREGVLLALTTRSVDVAIARAPASVRFTDRTSRRWVAYRRDVATGLVTAVDASDGRTVQYAYDDEGRLASVERDCGRVAYEFDEHGYLSAVTDADGIVVCRNEYDAAGRVASQVEHHGRKTRYEYRADGVSTVTATDGAPPNVMVHDRRGRMTAMIDGLGHAMRVTYDDADNVVQLVDRTGAVTRYEYDERGNTARRIDPDGLTHRFEWDDLDRVVVEVDRAGGTTRFHYEGTNREPALIVQADGAEVRLTHDDRGLVTSVTDADGVSASLSWNRDGLLESLANDASERTSFRYDDAGRTIGASLPGGRSSAAALDVAGRVVTLYTPDGEQAFEYSAAGRTVGGRTEGGAAWQALLDGAGDLAALADVDGEVLRFERDLVGQVTSTVDGEGGRYGFEHDTTGRQTAVIDPRGNRTEVGYDPEGRLVQVTDPDGRHTSRELDALGRTTMAVAPGGGTSVRSYHPNGELASATDANGNEWSYEVDAMGRVVASTDPLGATTTYRYTPAGRLAEIRSPLGRTVRRHYDAVGRLAKVVEPDGTEVLFERDADGATTRVTRDGVPTAFDYDESGRLSCIAGPWAEVSIERAVGEVVAIAAPGVESARYEHDGRGLLQQVVDPAGVITEFTYDRCGRPIAQATGETTTRYERDAAGQLSAVVDAYGNRTAFERDPRGIVDQISRPDGTATVRRFGPDGRLEAAFDGEGTELLAIVRDANGTVTGARTPGARLEVDQDVVGRPTLWATDAGSVRYRWDADGYLTAMDDGASHQVTLERDGSGTLRAFDVGGRRVERPEPVQLERDGNRRISVDEAGRRYRYDTAGRLAEAHVAGASTTYGYDDRGLLATERTADGVTAYRHGATGELTTKVDPHGRTTTFEHDPTGRRTAEVCSDGSRTTYRWDAFGRLAEVQRIDADGRTVDHQIEHDPIGRPMRVDGTPILWDGANTGNLLGIGDERYLWSGNQVLTVTDPESAWSRLVGDDPWGDDGGSGVRLSYRGSLAVDGLLFLGARVYDTRTRTFLSRDPLPSVPGAVTFAGVYSYAWCDPVNLVDPTGLRPLSDEEYDAFREQASQGFFRKHWKTIAKAAVIVGSIVAVAAATVLLPGIGGVIVAGALIGAANSGLMTAIDGGSMGDIARSAAIGGLFGGATAGLSRFIPPSAATSLGGRLLSNAGRNAAIEFPAAFGQEAVDSKVIPGGDGRFDLDDAFMSGATGTIGGVAGAEIDRHLLPNMAGALDGETPSSLLPDPARNTVLDINTASAADLERIDGIGPATSRRIIEQREAAGGFTSTQQLLEIDGIGQGRLDLINGAGGIAQ